MSKRLSFESIARPEGEKPPGRCVFLSVEGNTERDYFQWVNKYEKELSISSSLHIEILGRRKTDTYSAPTQVLELLKEYMELRKSESLPQYLQNAIPEKYDAAFIEQYLNAPDAITDTVKKAAFEAALEIAGIDLDYCRYLKSISNCDDGDVFGVVIDRDAGCHTEQQMKSVIEYCKERQCCCLISNPCFDFWLLLHLSDVKNTYKECLGDIRENKRINDTHTFVSKEVSEKTHNSKKTIPEGTFKRCYLGNIDTAIERSKDFAEEPEVLFEKIGTSIPKLFKILREQA